MQPRTFRPSKRLAATLRRRSLTVILCHLNIGVRWPLPSIPIYSHLDPLSYNTMKQLWLRNSIAPSIRTAKHKQQSCTLRRRLAASEAGHASGEAMEDTVVICLNPCHYPSTAKESSASVFMRKVFSINDIHVFFQVRGICNVPFCLSLCDASTLGSL